MIVKNISKNTIYIEDLDIHIPYDGNEIEILPLQLMKSKQLQKMIFAGLVNVIKYDNNEQIEKSIVYNLKNIKKQGQTNIDNYESTDCDLDVSLKGIFYEAGGYGKVNRYFAKSLSELGARVRIVPKKGQNQLNLDELNDIIKMEQTSIGKNHISIDSIIPSFSDTSSSPYNIIYTTVESYSLPKQFIDCCRQYKEIWVTSPFAKQIISQYIKDRKIFIVPTGVDSEIYNENVEPIVFNPPLKKFVFISVFGWSYRKGYDMLLKSYFDAFSERDDVSLLLLSRYMQGVGPSYIKKIQSDIDKLGLRKENAPHYRICSKIIPEKMMPRIYKACNAFVLPSRGESSCLTPCEASLCGLPVIMTNASGQTLYLNKENSFLLEVDKFEKVQPGEIHLHYWDNQIFPSLKSEKCIKELAGIMRNVYENYNDAVEKNENLQKLLIKDFSWLNAGKIAIERLKEIKHGNCFLDRSKN